MNTGGLRRRTTPTTPVSYQEHIVKTFITGLIADASEHLQKALDRGDENSAQYWTGKIIAAKNIEAVVKGGH